MKITLAYGHDGLDIEVPDRNLPKILTPPDVPPIEDPGAFLLEALEHPIESPSLSTVARKAKSACIVISDITRPVPNKVLLPPLLRTLEACGLPRERVTILVATGLHRASTRQELEAIVGADILARYRVDDHHARVSGEHQFLGYTRRETPVSLDRRYWEADIKITTGFIEPHLMAGFSGGRKLIAPGCAGEETIKALHSPLFLEDPRCREGCIEGNPLHQELLEIAGMAGHDFIVNVSLDAARKITGLFAGEPLAAHAAGVEFVRKSVRATVPAPADIVVTTSAGYPLDLTLYQAVKGITAAMPVLRKGGLLIIAAECAEGLGSAEFTAMATSFPTASQFVDTIMSNPVVIDQWQLEECAKAVRHAEVVLMSPSIHREYAGKLFIRTAESVEKALEEGVKVLGSDASVAVIPKGPYTLVEIEN
ncbi:nickel-dependent lactate racemase [bacterium]|nr:MAG: nickel-dependent lactate racemase [bacterium]